MISEQTQEILDELYKVNPENLNEKARRLFDTVMEIADERDLYKYSCEKAIEKLEYYNSGEALYYVPIPQIIDILKGERNNE